VHHKCDVMNKQEVLDRTNLPTFLTLFKNVICIKTSVCPNITLVGNSVPILKHSHIQNNVSNKRTVGSSWSFTVLNFSSVGTTANSCISGSRNFIIFLYFNHLRRKLNSLQRYGIAQNYLALLTAVRTSNPTSYVCLYIQSWIIWFLDYFMTLFQMRKVNNVEWDGKMIMNSE
jgi:hypothetical protein